MAKTPTTIKVTIVPRIEWVHLCPPTGEGLTPCCHHTPFELPRWHRITADPSLATCPGTWTWDR